MRLGVEELPDALQQSVTSEPAPEAVLAPVEPGQEVWAAGVTYLSSRMAREAESQSSDVYPRVYDAERPELFFKAVGWRVVGPDGRSASAPTAPGTSPNRN